jgi:hypothetical protein
MDIPQVGDQVRKAPTQAIRAVFAGIGKILLAADRPEASPRPGPKHAAPGGRAPQATVPQTTAPPATVPQTTAPPATASQHTMQQATARAESPSAATPSAETLSPAASGPRWRSLDETGNVRLLSTEELTVGHGTVVAATPVQAAPDGQGRAAAVEASLTPVASQPLSGNVPIGAGFVIHELPLPGYDTLPVASIRARLRGLDVDQLQALLVHEHKNAERPEVIAMIERRIAKLENGA